MYLSLPSMKHGLSVTVLAIHHTRSETAGNESLIPTDTENQSQMLFQKSHIMCKRKVHV